MKIEDELTKKIKQQALASYRKLIKQGVSDKVATKQVIKQFNNDIIGLMAVSVNKAGVGSVTAASMAKLAVGDVALSDVLYTHGKQTASNVAMAVSSELKKAKTVRDLALNLYEGYGFNPKNDIKLQKQLPKYLIKDWNKTKVKNLKSKELRAAYMEAVEAKIKGASTGVINKKLKVAFEERNRFLAIKQVLFCKFFNLISPFKKLCLANIGFRV